ncbi:adenine-specific methyltransferase EcoRI family protein, partial [Lactobacillus helveticus]|uniref:adenine-specific methyltransferase EcoRI family protein n=1 Tax=Lactobacillus helveticus TaxID=1587 RepID=UPI001561E1DA
MPADDPFESNFFKFFALHFKDYGLKKLIATSYDGSPIVNTQLSLFDDVVEQTSRFCRAYKIELDNMEDINHDGVFNLNDIEDLLNREKYKLNHGDNSHVLSYLKGDENYPAGDFRSREVTKLRDEADIIITNPPFSLFREFMKWIEPTKRHFLVIGNNNAVTYKEIFPLIKNNIVWLGVHNGDMAFRVPADYPPRKTRYWVDEHNQKWRSLGNIDWITNLDHGRRHQPLSLMSMEQNIRFSRHKQVREDGYVH